MLLGEHETDVWREFRLLGRSFQCLLLFYFIMFKRGIIQFYPLPFFGEWRNVATGVCWGGTDLSLYSDHLLLSLSCTRVHIMSPFPNAEVYKYFTYC